MNIEKSDILILIPAYNESRHIADVVKDIRSKGYPHVVVIDDGSTDDTYKKAKSAGAKMLRHLINRGAGAATQTGFSYAVTTDIPYVVTIDADKQHNSLDISNLVHELEKAKADIAIGNRFMKGTNNIPQSRNIFNGVANLITFTFAWRWVSDSQSGLKAFSQTALRRIELILDGYEFCSEIIIKAAQLDLKIIEIPAHVYYTPESIKKGQGFLNGIKTVSKLLQSVIFKLK